MVTFYMCFLFHTLATNMIRFYYSLVKCLTKNTLRICVCVCTFFLLLFLSLLFAILLRSYGPLTLVLFYYHTIHAFSLNPYLCIILYDVCITYIHTKSMSMSLSTYIHYVLCAGIEN